MTGAANPLRVEDPPNITERRLVALYDYWLELAAAAGGLPALSAFDPLRLTDLLPHIWVVEVDDDTHRFRMRLAGEEINQIYGRNVGGHYFANLFSPTDLPTIVARYSRALRDPAVFYAQGAVYAAAGRRSIGERLGLPMLGRSGRTSILIGATLYGGRVDETAPVMITGDSAAFHAIQAANHASVEITGG